MNLKNRHIIYVASMLYTLNACSPYQDALPMTTQQSGKASFVFSMVEPSSRVSYTGYIHSDFEGGEELGAYVIDKTGNTIPTTDGKKLPEYDFVAEYTKNARYRVIKKAYTGNDGVDYTQALEPVIPSDIFPTGKRYVFYYPYKAGADIQHFEHTVLANQNHAGAFETSDLLRARVNGTEDESTVESSVIGTGTNGEQFLRVAMDHVMASIVLKVEPKCVPTDGGEAKLLGIYRTVSGIDLTRALSQEEQSEAGYSYTTGEEVDKGDITMWNTEEKDDSDYRIYRAVIPAQAVEQGKAFLSFRFSEDTKAKTYNTENELHFLPGKYYLFTLTQEKGLRFNGIINDLEDGGDYYYEY